MFPWHPMFMLVVVTAYGTLARLNSSRRADVDSACLYSVSGHCESTLQAPWARKVFGAALAGFCPDGGNACAVGVFGSFHTALRVRRTILASAWRWCSKRAMFCGWF